MGFIFTSQFGDNCKNLTLFHKFNKTFGKNSPIIEIDPRIQLSCAFNQFSQAKHILRNEARMKQERNQSDRLTSIDI